MKFNKILAAIIIPLAIVACGEGQTSNTGSNYYSASYSSYYQIESSSGESGTNLTFSIVTSSGNLINQAPLTLQSGSTYSYSQGNTTGTVTLSNGNLGVSYQNTQGPWIDFATQYATNSIPNGTYNAVCDQTNLSPCQVVVANNTISITEYSITGQPTSLCSNSSIQKVSVGTVNPYLSQFSCGVNGGSHSGIWYIAPITINNTTALMLSEYDFTINNNNDETDEIAFPNNQAISPSGTYNYLFNGLNGVGVSTAQFSSSGLVNNTIGTCAGAACALIQNQYYNGNSMTGFDWYNVNGMNNYNLVGSNSMNIYQDSFEGFYF